MNLLQGLPQGIHSLEGFAAAEVRALDGLQRRVTDARHGGGEHLRTEKDSPRVYKRIGFFAGLWVFVRSAFHDVLLSFCSFVLASFIYLCPFFLPSFVLSLSLSLSFFHS